MKSKSLLVAVALAARCEAFAGPRPPLRTSHARGDAQPHSSSPARLRGGGGGGAAAALALDVNPVILRLTRDSMAELLTSCAIGYGATKAGYLSGSQIRSLAGVVFNVFLPAMLLTSVASTVAEQQAGAALAVMPIAAWAQVAVGASVASVSLALLRLPRRSSAGRGVSVLSSFGNAGVLPLLFVSSLFRGAAQEATRRRATSLVAMFLLGWSPLFWTLGYALLTGHAALSPAAAAAAAAEPAATATAAALSPATSATAATAATAALPVGAARAARLRQLRASLRRALSPPIAACLAGLVVGSAPPLRAALLPAAAPSAPSLQSWLPLFRCLEALGKAYSPAALLVLAGSLAAPTEQRRAGEGELGASASHVVAIAVARFCAVPLLSFALLHAALRAGLLPADPLRDLVLLLQSCMPSAQNSVLALQVDGSPERAARMARVLLAIYLIAALPVAGILSLLLQRYSAVGGVGLATLGL
ncbi:hypothetical protein EMIHUDRAFT_452869 [Emiliania huxleyi CCMP1516]|uniref:Auxin efflux carrier n=2 Tax=Emiliania huxleyi TaxID=2903 RepID=A0A0D3ID82_EMIH1|nr:hypothetical protein EMIHUDRAFT_452869 [Emiliania huxleyi CCMP1516]EOD09217.1 hypothetical protein EMIHUDRAFT_452869 [Emiliania huxleyi CCMP1516]|eukprot:XP_005761646.1 hypothetical protein EMIHUDRAFT_452869 [Emiliania huxleyi CCMP1516]